MSDFDPKECERLARVLAASTMKPETMEAKSAVQLRAACAEVERLTGALTKISAIRDSIVGMQGFNFSEHAYPLVAVLDGLGFKGAGYEIASKNLGTLIEQRDKAEADRDRLAAEFEQLKAHVSLVEAREKQATGMCSWLTKENQRLRDVVGLSEHLDAELDELMEDVEDECVSRVIAENNAALLAANLAALTSDLAKYRALVEAYAPVRDLIGDWKWTDMDWSDLRDSDLAERVVGALAETERRTALAAPKEKPDE